MRRLPSCVSSLTAAVLITVSSLTASEATAVPTSLVPLAVFDIAAGQAVSIDGRSAPADSAGLPLPLGKPVEVAWQTNGADMRYTIINVDSSTGAMAPAWAVAETAAEPDGKLIASGFAFAGKVPFCLAKALSNARLAAQHAGPGQSTTVVTDTDQGGASGRSEVTTTTFSGSVTSETIDQVITVCADPEKAPPVPLKPGTESRKSAQPGKNPVRCWVRIKAEVKASTPGEQKQMDQARERARADAREAFKALDEKVREESGTK